MDMVEVFPVQDIFVSALGRIDILPGGFGRMVFYVDRCSACDGRPERVVVASIVMSLEAIKANRQMVNDALRAIGAPIPEELSVLPSVHH